MSAASPSTVDPITARAAELFDALQTTVHGRADRLFAWLMGAQWAFGIVLAVLISPYAWEGKIKSTHVHVYAAVLLGGAISSLPILLALRRPGWVVTRHVVAVAQMTWSALLIHLTGGRIETHFHVFGSLAFLAFYRDYRVLVTATLAVVADHLLRGFLWPESVYGIANPEWWRFLEHAGWVLFADVVLAIMCVEGTRELCATAERQADIEALSAREQEKSRAVSQLAASIGHELRNPLAAVQAANTFIRKRVGDASSQAPAPDPRVPKFLDVIDREVGVCVRTIADLLAFARERPPVLAPCPLRALVDEASSLVMGAKARIVNDVPPDLPVPRVDKEQFRRVLINLLQNAVDAQPEGQGGEVTVRAEGGGDRPHRIVVADDGVGIPADVAAKIFEPLFTTKTKGTGLGLAIVANIVKGHRGSIRVESEAGAGARFIIELPSPGGA
jgi:two-component system, NtrC family, sensor histidine kinase HydH